MNLKKNLALLSKVEGKILAGELTRKQGLTLLGEVAAKQMVSRINAGIGPDLADSTVQRRRSRSTKPLIDTGQLKGSITFKINDGGDSHD